MLRTGSAASVLQAFFYVTAVTAAAFTPEEQIVGTMAQFSAAYSGNALPTIVMSLSFVFLGLLGLGAVVPATASLFPEKDMGWITFGKNIAMLSLSAITIYFTWFLATLHERVALFRAGGFSLNPHAPMNWIGWFAFGGMGLWVVIVGMLVWVRGVLPKGFVFVCAVKAIGFWVILAETLLDSYSIAKTGAVAGGLIGGTLYHLWLGIALWKMPGLGNKEIA